MSFRKLITLAWRQDRSSKDGPPLTIGNPICVDKMDLRRPPSPPLLLPLPLNTASNSDCAAEIETGNSCEEKSGDSSTAPDGPCESLNCSFYSLGSEKTQSLRGAEAEDEEDESWEKVEADEDGNCGSKSHFDRPTTRAEKDITYLLKDLNVVNSKLDDVSDRLNHQLASHNNAEKSSNSALSHTDERKDASSLGATSRFLCSSPRGASVINKRSPCRPSQPINASPISDHCLRLYSLICGSPLADNSDLFVWRPRIADRVATRGAWPSPDSPISVDEVTVEDFAVMVGAWVFNLAFEKRLVCLWTFDEDWSMSAECRLEHQRHNDDKHVDRFMGYFVLPRRATHVELVFRYEVNGRKFWDNNNGRNYRLDRHSLEKCR